MEKKKPNLLMAFLKHPMVTAIIGTLVGTLLGGLVTAYVTATNVEQATVELMANRLEIVEKKDTLEEAINKVNKEVDKKNADIEEKTAELEKKDQEIADLTRQLNDDTEINNLNEKLEEKQKEIDKLQATMDDLQKEKNELQIQYDELLQKKYDEYTQEAKSNAPISLANLEALKCDNIVKSGEADTSINGTKFSYYFETDWTGEQSIEYALDGQYREFKGMAYITKVAYGYFDENSPELNNASISIEVKYNDSDDYRVKDSVVGLIPDSAPVELKADLIGVTKMKIVFRGAWYNQHPVIRLGEPALY